VCGGRVALSPTPPRSSDEHTEKRASSSTKLALHSPQSSGLAAHRLRRSDFSWMAMRRRASGRGCDITLAGQHAARRDGSASICSKRRAQRAKRLDNQQNARSMHFRVHANCSADADECKLAPASQQSDEASKTFGSVRRSGADRAAKNVSSGACIAKK
jgi:hypothetical protein